MHGIEDLFSRLKQVDRPNGAKEETLQKLQESRTRKRSPLLPTLLTGIVIAAAVFFIMMNVNPEDGLEQANGIVIENIEKSILLKSVSIDFNDELIDHIGTVEITDDPAWENSLTAVLETMVETDTRPEGMSLYDLEVHSEDELYRFKIWQVNDEILIKDFDNSVYYQNSGQDVETVMELASEFIMKLEQPIVETEDEVVEEEEEKEEEVTIPSLGMSKEQFKEKYNNTYSEDFFLIRIGEIKEVPNQNRVNYELYVAGSSEESWEFVELSATYNPKTNELTQLTFFETNPLLKGPGHDRLHWYYMLTLVRSVFELEISEDGIIDASEFFDDDRSKNIDKQLNLSGFTLTFTLHDNEMQLIVEPADLEK